MAIQYKPTKQKKEKPPKAPKEPKAEKPIEIGVAQKVKLDKPKKEKAPKAEKPVIDGVSKVKLDKPKKLEEPNANDAKTENAPEIKPEKVKGFAPIFKGGKLENKAEASKNNILLKINPVVAISIIVALLLVVVLIFAVVIPAIKRNGEQIEYIMVSEMPEKTVYYIGDKADYDGLKILVTRKNGDTFTIGANQCQITGFDSSAETISQMLTVTYEGFVATFSIQVKEPPKVAPALAGIRLDPIPIKTVYRLGEVLDVTGGVIVCEYVDGSEFRIALEPSNILGFVGINGSGEYELTVKYIENGIIAYTTYTITVTE